MKRKIRFYILNIILFIVILGVAAFLFIYMCCGVKTREYEGSTIYTDEELSDLLFTEKYDDNVVSSWFMSLFRPKKGIPFVEKVTITPTSLTSLKVTIQEKERYGVVQMSDTEFDYFDSAYKVVGCSDHYIAGTPLFMLSSLDKEAKAGEALPTGSANKKIMGVVIKETSDRGIAYDNTVINGDGTIVMHIGGVEIRFGNRTNLKEKIMRLPYILPKLVGMSGILHLEDWTEENTDIVFEKAG